MTSVHRHVDAFKHFQRTKILVQAFNLQERI
jgi:hypothetical protein